jgi:predicted RNase H-like HicB family nuclease
MRTYFAIVHKDEDSAVGVVFPDLPGCFSAGDTYDKAIANAHVALRLYAEAEQDAGRQLPKPRTFEALYRDPEVRQEARGAPFVGIRLEGLTEAKVKRGATTQKLPRRPPKPGEFITIAGHPSALADGNRRTPSHTDVGGGPALNLATSASPNTAIISSSFSRSRLVAGRVRSTSSLAM